MTRFELFKHKIWVAVRFNVFQFVKYNFLSKNIHRAKHKYIYPFFPGKILIRKNSEIILNGNLWLNKPMPDTLLTKGNLFMPDKGKMIVNGEAVFCAGYCIQNVGILEIGDRFRAAEGSRIICHHAIKFGDGGGISVYTVVRDTTNHPSGTNPDKLTVTKEPVVIGDHVWIGTHAAIYAGTVIGDGAIIGNYAKVSGVIPPRTMVAPKLDKVVLSGVYWYFTEETKKAEFEKYYSDLKPMSEIVPDAPASEETVGKVCDLFAELGYDDDIREQQDLIGSKAIDSLSMMSLIAELETRFQVTIPVEKLNVNSFYSIETIASMLDSLKKKNTRTNATDVSEENSDEPFTANNILDYLSECARKCPEKIAVSSREHSVTFAEMEQKAKRYGKAIADAMPDNTAPKAVGIICSRDVEPIIAFFGVAYSGNFYVPLDPDTPKDKLKSIIDDADMEVIVGDAGYEPLMRELCFDGTYITPEKADAVCGGDLPDGSTVSADSPLYMIYTSGSTGKPKGVLKSHKAEISFIEAYCETFRFENTDVIGNQTPFFFDGAAKDIYLMLKKRLTMEIIPTEYFTVPVDLIRYLNERQITVTCWVPSALTYVAQFDPFSKIKPETLRMAFFVGEVMPMKHLNTWRKALPDIQYVNLYGQSELCGICCYYEVKGTFADDKALPMGVPLKNSKIILLDNETVVTEPGKVGEMYIISDALATEYYGDKEKTKASFVMKDFGEGEVRCFKTGDLARYDDGGNLVFVSRADFQIKHMGYRIELGEIETVAGAMPEIARCCCLYNAERKMIVLFCELSDGYSLKGTEIINLLKNKLSSYMLPQMVKVLERLPLNANGKIDRQKLKELL